MLGACDKSLRHRGLAKTNEYPFTGEVWIFWNAEADALIAFWDDAQLLGVDTDKSFVVYRSILTVHSLVERAPSTLIPALPPPPKIAMKPAMKPAGGAAKGPAMSGAAAMMSADKAPAPASAPSTAGKKKGCGCQAGAQSVPLPLLRYKTPDGQGKVVRYWAARSAKPHHERPLAARPSVEPASLREIDDVVWVSAATARQMLTRASDHRPLDTLEDLWRRGRLDSRVLAIVRHGQAVPRNRWKKGEASRPLTGVGRRQAETIVPVLAAFGVRSVLTSPWERCRATVAPYLSRTGVRMDTVDALTEAAHAQDPQKVVAVIEDLLAQPRDVALATHRPVLPTVMDTLAEATRRWTHGILPSADPYLRTGEVLVAHVVGLGSKARVVAVEHHRPVRQPATV